MNQEKIGKFILERRKLKKMTQEDLAEKLGVSDRAVSKWERAINLPDASLMLELSNILDISVNELLSGEKIEKDKYINNAEKRLIELKEINESYSKKLLFLDFVVGLSSSLTFFILIFVSSYIEMNNIIRALLIIYGIVVFFVGAFNCIKIEQIAGFYECKNCHYKYVPTFKEVFFSTHIGTSRKLKCPKCNKKSWNKKVINN